MIMELSDKNMVGNKHIWDYLFSAHKSGRLGQAYLFYGPKGVGKATCARLLAQAVLNTKTLDQHPDFVVVERERDPKTGNLKHEISVERIRQFRNDFQSTSFFGGKKVALFEDVQFMSQAGFNALLKTLEEPAGQSLLIMTTSDLEVIPKTIRSRAALLRFLPVAEGRMIEAGLSSRSARLAAGSPGVTRDLESPERAKEALSELNQLLKAPIYEKMKIIDGWFGKKVDHAEAVEIWREKLRLWKLALRETVLSKTVPELVQLDEMRENSLKLNEAADLIRRLERIEKYADQHVSLRILLDACFLT